MKKIVVLLLTVIMLLTGTSCSKKEEPNPMQPEVLQMKKFVNLLL